MDTTPPRLLLLSSSRTAGTAFLQHAREPIENFLDGEERHAVFLPYAAIRFSYDEYTERVRDWFTQVNCTVSGLHRETDPLRALSEANVVVVGGGNTFHLLAELYRHDLLDTIRRRVTAGARYIGWSAGTNVSCPSIRTTNDMPVVWPPDCSALGLIPFQINPHYTDAHPPGHQGETRAERLAEFTALNPDTPVVGLREGSGLHVANGRIRLLGEQAAQISRGSESWEAAPGSWIEGMLQHSG